MAIVTVEAQLKDIVQNLYNLIVQAYDHHGSKTQEAMKREMYVKWRNLVWSHILIYLQPGPGPESGTAVSNGSFDTNQYPT